MLFGATRMDMHTVHAIEQCTYQSACLDMTIACLPTNMPPQPACLRRLPDV